MSSNQNIALLILVVLIIIIIIFAFYSSWCCVKDECEETNSCEKKPCKGTYSPNSDVTCPSKPVCSEGSDLWASYNKEQKCH